MESPRVDIHLIVHNGQKYIKHCLEAVKAQTYPNIKFRVFDNASTDSTLEIIKKEMPKAEIIKLGKNFVLGGGFNRSLYCGDAPYVVGLSVDILMAPDFIEKAVATMEKNKKHGALQAKILYWDFQNKKNTNILDTTGMQIYKSRRVINRGHGERDEGQYNKTEEVFCYEGAVPFFRRAALEDAKLKKFKPYYAEYESNEDAQKYPYEYLDEDFVWYADEVDLGWRMRLLGWGSLYEPSVLAWHDRQTTHKLSGSYRAFIKQRKEIPPLKRMLDLRNLRLTFIKNDFCGNILRALPSFLKREVFMFIYVLIWERSSLTAYGQGIKMLPKMLKKRKTIMARRKVSPAEMRAWFK